MVEEKYKVYIDENGDETWVPMMREEKEIDEYLDEAECKVWYMRSDPDKYPVALEGCKIVEERFPEVLEGFTDWGCGYWNGVMATLRWVLGDEEKNNLDT